MPNTRGEKIHTVVISHHGAKILHGELHRCPVRMGPDQRECSIDNIKCMFGVSETIVPNGCPLHSGSIVFKLMLPRQ